MTCMTFKLSRQQFRAFYQRQHKVTKILVQHLVSSEAISNVQWQRAIRIEIFFVLKNYFFSIFPTLTLAEHQNCYRQPARSSLLIMCIAPQIYATAHSPSCSIKEAKNLIKLSICQKSFYCN